MSNIDSISLNLSFEPVFLITAVIIIAVFSFFVYRFTIPDVSKTTKITLILLRSFALILLVFAIFEPIFIINRNKEVKPQNYIFIDNSRSISGIDSASKISAVNDFLISLSRSELSGIKIFEFGEDISYNNNNPKLSFNDKKSNFNNIFNTLPENENISSITLISDGIISEGESPIYAAEKKNIPVYTIGIGDTTHKNNIELYKILYNDIVYVESPTVINASIFSKGFNGKEVNVNFYENNELKDSKKILLYDNDQQSLNFEYIPENIGDNKLQIRISELEGEENYTDNKSTFYIKVLDNKINLLLFSGSPTADLAFIKNNLSINKNYKVNTLTEITDKKYFEKSNSKVLIDSADVFYFIGFPSDVTNDQILNSVSKKVLDQKKPVFILINSNTDLNKLLKFNAILPFSLTDVNKYFSEAQLYLDNTALNDPLFKGTTQNILNDWNNLPPIKKNNSNFISKPGSKVLVKIKENNIPIESPLIISRNFSGSKSLVILGSEIWRWKLRNTNSENELFTNFILNTSKWLNTNEEQKLISVTPTKKIFSQNEIVSFSAKVLDETLEPINDAEVLINIISPENDTIKSEFSFVNNGLYENLIEDLSSGDYKYSANAYSNELLVGKDSGSFTVDAVDIELIRTRTDDDFLKLLSNQTGGKYFYQNNFNELFDMLKKKNINSSNNIIIKSEINLWSEEWLLIVIILLFSFEWFIRRRTGMI